MPLTLISRFLVSSGDVQTLLWDSKDKEIFAMLDDRFALQLLNKQNPLSKSFVNVIQHGDGDVTSELNLFTWNDNIQSFGWITVVK